MTKRERLAEIRRRLGPFTALQGSNEPWVLREAEIARRLVELIELVGELSDEIDRLQPEEEKGYMS